MSELRHGIRPSLYQLPKQPPLLRLDEDVQLPLA